MAQKFTIRIKDGDKGAEVTTSAKPPLTRDTPITAAGFIFAQLLQRIGELHQEMRDSEGK